MVRSAWSRTRSRSRTRSGSSAHSFLSRPNSRSTAARPLWSFHRGGALFGSIRRLKGAKTLICPLRVFGRFGPEPALLGWPALDQVGHDLGLERRCDPVGHALQHPVDELVGLLV